MGTNLNETVVDWSCYITINEVNEYETKDLKIEKWFADRLTQMMVSSFHNILYREIGFYRDVVQQMRDKP